MDAQTCPRLYWLRHHEWLTEADAKIWFAFGGAWGSAMDVIWKLCCGKKFNKNHVAELAFEAFVAEWVKRGEKDPDDIDDDELERIKFRNPATAHEMIFYYIERRTGMFQQPSIQLLSVEEPFAVPLMKENVDILYGGRWDKIIKLHGSIRAIEHKTTTAWRYPRNLREEYLKSFLPNNQIDGYIYAGRMKYGRQFNNVYVDIALVHKSQHDVFELLPIDRGPGDLEAWLWDTWYWVNEIERNLEASKTVKPSDPYMHAFPKKTASCYRFPHNCQFLPVCSTMSNPMGIKARPPKDNYGNPIFRIEKWDPFDHLKLDKIGLKKENER